MLREEQLGKQYQHLLKEASCEDLGCLRSTPDDVLRNATQETYKKAYAAEEYGHGNFYYGPYVDGTLIQDLPSREFKNGNFAKIPVLVSRERWEGFSFSNQSMTTIQEETQDLHIQFQSASEEFVGTVFELYPSSSFNSTFWQRQTWFGYVPFTLRLLQHTDNPIVTSVSTAQRTISHPPSPHPARKSGRKFSTQALVCTVESSPSSLMILERLVSTLH
jgi:carboxylesterase type B